MKKSEEKKLDQLVREKCKENFKACVVCGNTVVNVHHIEGRRNRATRWYLPNLVSLCAGCHTFRTMSAHQSPLRMRKFFIDSFGKKWEQDLIMQSNKVCKTTYEKVKDYLEGLTDNYC
ncbi:MAG TPA: hypothetical protein DHV62_09635 [Elusimicrobia bacterium]|jgi:5-methylcytosine-specific restriction endonuclease McrA|nr:hypothetical protein [Elusimicrobiota bacterium]